MLPREGGAARDVRDRARGEREEPRVGTAVLSVRGSVERRERPREIVRHGRRARGHACRARGRGDEREESEGADTLLPPT